MPKWAFRLTKDAASGRYISVVDGKARAGQDEYTEYMLCTACEKRMKPWEDYTKRVVVDLHPRKGRRRHDDPVWVTGHQRGDLVMVGGGRGKLPTLRLKRGKWRALKLFAISIFWRVSVGRNKPKPKFKLDDATEDLMQEALMGMSDWGLRKILRTKLSMVSDMGGWNAGAEEDAADRMITWPAASTGDLPRAANFQVGRFGFTTYIDTPASGIIGELKPRTGKTIEIEVKDGHELRARIARGQ